MGRRNMNETYTANSLILLRTEIMKRAASGFLNLFILLFKRLMRLSCETLGFAERRFEKVNKILLLMLVSQLLTPSASQSEWRTNVS